MPINLNQLVLYLSGIDADGTPPTANPILMAGQDGTNVQSLKTNATGQLEVDIVSGGGTGGLTDAELRATPVPVVTQEPISVDDNGGSLTVDGTVAVTDGGGSITVDGPLTDAQLRAAAVPVSLSSDIEIGAVELKNGSDDTRATVTAANALKVDGSAVTQPVSAASLPLPTGAATAANQQTDALTDTELRASPVDVDTGLVQGLTDTELRATPVPVSGTVAATLSEPISVDDNGGSLTVDGTVTAVGNVASEDPDTGNPVKVGGKYNAVQPLLTDGDRCDLQLNNNGSLQVFSEDGVALRDPGSNEWATIELADGDNEDGTSQPGLVTNSRNYVYDGTNWDRMRGDIPNGVDVDVTRLPALPAGTNNIGDVDVLTLPSDVTLADDAAFTVGTTKVVGAGLLADESSTDSVDEGDIGAGRMTLDRKAIVVNQPHSAGGCDIFRSLDLDETEEQVKATAGTVYGWAITNRRTSTLWLKFYNATDANVTVGSTTPVLTWGIPGNSTDNVGANMLGGVGIKFDTAITVAATTGFADADTGAPGANELIVNIFYK